MATTQAEKQQNDVNSEKVQSDQHLNVCNSLMQNGTDKSSVRGGASVVVAKGKSTGSKNLDIEMSQYRQDGGGGEQSLSEPEIGSTGDSGIYPTPPVSEGPPVGDGHGYGGFPFARDMHNSADGGLHAFGARQSFGAAKQPPGAFPQQRFLSGQTISQPTGPTPTLNQLLQSANPMQRYQNSYAHSEQAYNQAWSPQKPLAPYAPTGASATAPGPTYRNQSTVSTAPLSATHFSRTRTYHDIHPLAGIRRRSAVSTQRCCLLLSMIRVWQEGTRSNLKPQTSNQIHIRTFSTDETRRDGTKMPAKNAKSACKRCLQKHITLRNECNIIK